VVVLLDHDDVVLDLDDVVVLVLPILVSFGPVLIIADAIGGRPASSARA